MPTETLPPARAARQIGIPPNTLRAWCRTYAEFLSPGANPGQGEERRLTPGDVETLRAVAQMRANDLPPEDIQNRLRENPSISTEGLPRPPESPTTPLNVPAPMNMTPSAVEAFLAHAGTKLDDVAAKLDDVDRRVERMQSQRNMLWIAIGAFVAGAVVVGIIALIVLSSMR